MSFPILALPSTSGLQISQNVIQPINSTDNTSSLANNVPVNTRKPRFYSPAHPTLSPFKNHLKIDDSVIITRSKTSKREQNNCPSIRAISGNIWHKKAVEKQVAKELIVKEKEDRKKKREEKKVQKAQIVKKGKSKKKLNNIEAVESDSKPEDPPLKKRRRQ